MFNFPYEVATPIKSYFVKHGLGSHLSDSVKGL